MRLLLALLCLQLCGADAITPTKPLRLLNGRNLDGWYTWLRDSKYQDPKQVFSIVNGQLRISGEEWGGIATKESFRDYHLIVEWRWGGKTWPPREKKARDSGILIHAVGPDGTFNPIWLESIESQIIEGGAGDIILVAGEHKPQLTVDARTQGKEQYWQSSGTPVKRDNGRFNWWGRSPQWRDELGFRGSLDVERPAGQWNRQEIIADGGKVTCLVNGKVVIHGYNASHRAGKIQIQSEGAEIFVRRVELRPITQRPKLVVPQPRS